MLWIDEVNVIIFVAVRFFETHCIVLRRNVPHCSTPQTFCRLSLWPFVDLLLRGSRLASSIARREAWRQSDASLSVASPHLTSCYFNTATAVVVDVIVTFVVVVVVFDAPFLRRRRQVTGTTSRRVRAWRNRSKLVDPWRIRWRCDAAGTPGRIPDGQEWTRIRLPDHGRVERAVIDEWRGVNIVDHAAPAALFKSRTTLVMHSRVWSSCQWFLDAYSATSSGQRLSSSSRLIHQLVGFSVRSCNDVVTQLLCWCRLHMLSLSRSFSRIKNSSRFRITFHVCCMLSAFGKHFLSLCNVHFLFLFFYLSYFLLPLVVNKDVHDYL